MEQDEEITDMEGTLLSQPLFSDVVACPGMDGLTAAVDIISHDDEEWKDSAEETSAMIRSTGPMLESNLTSEPVEDEAEVVVPFFTASSDGGSGKRVGVVAARIRKLDAVTSSTIRKTQVISKVSDVVRELVENSVDSEAGSIQVHLTNFGLDKIEVRDTGHGIAASELCNAVAGGYTSKLEDKGHLSSQSFYGFRGEALSSICSVASVCVTTKTAEDTTATKYELDNKSFLTSATVVAGGNGTIVVAANLFEKFPVRRLWIKDKKKCTAELKDMETFLKSVAIVNPQTHISLYHNSSLVWNKASVTSIDQALVTVLGHFISRSLQKCGPIDISVFSEEEEDDHQQQRTIEAFFLRKPIDMKNLSWTGRKMTFLFVNRKRVIIEELEKIIQRYTFAAIEKPAPADARRFPAAVVNINLPTEEVDFNREMDKTKVFIVYKDLVLQKLEELLQTYYGITSSLDKLSLSGNKENLPEEVEDASSTKQALEAPNESDRQNTIKSFLENVPVVSNANFSRSPTKNVQEGAVFASTSSPFNSSLKKGSVEDSHQIISVPTTKSNPEPCISNFDLNMDDILMDTPPDDIVEVVNAKGTGVEAKRNDQHNQQPQPVLPNGTNEIVELDGRESDLNQWLRRRSSDSHGSGDDEAVKIRIRNHSISISSPAVVNPSPSSSAKLSIPHNSVVNSNLNKTRHGNAFDRIGSGLENVQTPDPKRPKLLNDQRYSSSSTSHRSLSQLGMSLSGSGRQVTLDHFENWDSPAPKRKSLSSSSSEYTFNSPMLKPSRFTPSPSPSNAASASPFATPMPKVRNMCSKSTSIGTTDMGSRIPSRNLWEQNHTSTMKQATVASMDINKGGCVEPGNFGTLLGTISGDASFYPAKINGHIGIFHPMNMLLEFPSLKFELSIDLDPVSERGGGGVDSNYQYQYTVASDCVPKLFNDFVHRVDQTCEDYPKIFHKLINLNNVRGTWEKNFTKSHSSNGEDISYEGTQTQRV